MVSVITIADNLHKIAGSLAHSRKPVANLGHYDHKNVSYLAKNNDIGGKKGGLLEFVQPRIARHSQCQQDRSAHQASWKGFGGKLAEQIKAFTIASDMFADGLAI